MYIRFFSEQKRVKKTKIEIMIKTRIATATKNEKKYLKKVTDLRKKRKFPRKRIKIHNTKHPKSIDPVIKIVAKIQRKNQKTRIATSESENLRENDLRDSYLNL